MKMPVNRTQKPSQDPIKKDTQAQTLRMRGFPSRSQEMVAFTLYALELEFEPLYFRRRCPPSRVKKPSMIPCGEG
ncbi:hypothetical protein ES288_A05G192900v1 [Gossypium darwinii]|uniref:Uncharacterized protein n=1 Tax=Gossypium darwinii TaxID=34276 RepID=A0A5D2GH58_GOSDA|nr:hypothetical protein ES288_A05G192900v1 [Gossypium darwinii]